MTRALLAVAAIGYVCASVVAIPVLLHAENRFTRAVERPVRWLSERLDPD